VPPGRADLIEVEESLRGAVPASAARVLVLGGGGFFYPRRYRGREGLKMLEIPLSDTTSASLVLESRHCGAITVETRGEGLALKPFLRGHR